MKLLRWTLLALLAACASTAQNPRDNVTIVWNKVDDPNLACRKLDSQPDLFRIRGCSKWSDASSGARICSIYAREPKSELDREAFATLGHELMHCFDGNWHDRWGHMNPREKNDVATAND